MRKVRNRRKKARYAQNSKDREEALVAKNKDRDEAQVGEEEALVGEKEDSGVNSGLQAKDREEAQVVKKEASGAPSGQEAKGEIVEV